MPPTKPLKVFTILALCSILTAFFLSPTSPVEEPKPLPAPVEEEVIIESPDITATTGPVKEDPPPALDMLPHHIDTIAVEYDANLSLEEYTWVLMQEYSWGSGDTVSALQALLGVTIDGQYGTQTRRAHLDVLRQSGWSIDNVPDVPDVPDVPAVTDPNPECAQWWDTARAAGWAEDRLPKLGRIMFSESRCTHDVISRTNDFGLTQINWAAHGDRLSAAGITKDMLLDPYVNLVQAKLLADYAENHYGCWSQPWYMSGSWC